MRFRVRETGKLEELAKYYLTNISTLQSFNIITGDKEGRENVNGKWVTYKPLWKWLFCDKEILPREKK